MLLTCGHVMAAAPQGTRKRVHLRTMHVALRVRRLLAVQSRACITKPPPRLDSGSRVGPHLKGGYTRGQVGWLAGEADHRCGAALFNQVPGHPATQMTWQSTNIITIDSAAPCSVGQLERQIAAPLACFVVLVDMMHPSSKPCVAKRENRNQQPPSPDVYVLP